MNPTKISVILFLISFVALVYSACTTYPIAVSQITNCVNDICDVELDSTLRIPLKSGSDACLTYTVSNTTKTFTLNITTAEQLLVLDEYVHCGDVYLYHNTTCKCNNLPSSCKDDSTNRYIDSLFPYNYRLSSYGPSSGCPFSWGAGADYCAHVSPMFDFRFDTYVVRDQAMHVAFVASDGSTTTNKIWDSNGITTMNVGQIKADISLIGTPRDSHLVGKMLVIDTHSNTKVKVLTEFNDASSFNVNKFCYAKIANGQIAFDFDAIKAATTVRPIDCYGQASAVQLNSGSHIKLFNSARTLDDFSGYKWNVHFTENNVKNTLQDSSGLLETPITDNLRYYNHHSRRFGIKFVNSVTDLPSDAFLEIGLSNFMVYSTISSDTPFYSGTCVKLLLKNTDGSHIAGVVMRKANAFSFSSTNSCSAPEYVGTYAQVVSPNFTKFYAVSQDGSSTTIALDSTGRVVVGQPPKDIIYRDTIGSASALVNIRGKISNVKMVSSSACLPTDLICSAKGRELTVDLASSCGDANVYVSFNETSVASSGTFMTSVKPISIRLNPNVDADRHVLLTACTSSSCSSCTFLHTVNYTAPVTTATALSSIIGSLSSYSMFPMMSGLYTSFLAIASVSGASYVIYETAIYGIMISSWLLLNVVFSFVMVPKFVKWIFRGLYSVYYFSPAYWVLSRLPNYLFTNFSSSFKKRKLKSK